jgi:hypothetical protein
VAAEYDGFADFPDRPWNVVAVANAIAGEIMRHIPSMFTDLSKVPAWYTTVTVNSLGGITTSYLVPAARLPLVELLPFLAPMEASLRKIVDAGYARNDGKPVSAMATVADLGPAPATAASTPPVAHPAQVTNTAPPQSNPAPRVSPARAATEDPSTDHTDIDAPPQSNPAPRVSPARAATEDPSTDHTDIDAPPPAPEAADRTPLKDTDEQPVSRQRGHRPDGSERSGEARPQTARPAGAADTATDTDDRPSASPSA